MGRAREDRRVSAQDPRDAGRGGVVLTRMLLLACSGWMVTGI